MRTAATIETDPEEKTITLTMVESNDHESTHHVRKTKINKQTKQHAKFWIAAQLELALNMLDEN